MSHGKEKIFDFCCHRKKFWESEMDSALQRLPIPLCERPLYGTGFDAFGVHWTDRSEVGGGCHYTQGQAPIITNISDWRNQVRFPNPDKADWSMFEKQSKAIDRERFAVMSTIIMGPFERTTSLTNFEDCLVNYLLEPEEMEALVSAIVDYKIELVKKVLQHGKPDIILLHDDWGTAKSPLLNPETWEQILMPQVQRLYNAVKEGGAYLGMHCCGNIAQMFPKVAAMGIDFWEAQAGCNPYEDFAREYPVSFMVHEAAEAMRPEVVQAMISYFQSIEGYTPFYKAVPEFLYD